MLPAIANRTSIGPLLLLPGVATALILSLTTATAVQATVPGADMVVSKSASVSEIPVGGEITYTLVAQNVGTAPATGVRVRDTRIDQQLIITAPPVADNPAMTCTMDEMNNLVCRMPQLNPGASVTINFTAQAPEAACVRVRNRARASSTNEPIENRDNNLSAFVSVKLNGCPPDTTPPTGSVSINDGTVVSWGAVVRLSLNVNDDRTGDASMLMRISNSPEVSGGRLVHATGEPYKPTRRWSLTDPDNGGVPGTGEKTVYVQYRDLAGNWSPVFSDSIQVRRDAPNSCLGAADTTGRPLDRGFRDALFPRGDVDWFKFRLLSQTQVTIRLSQLPLDYRLTLFNGSCQQIARSNNPGTTAETIQRTLPRGRYFIRVDTWFRGLASVQPYLVRINTAN